MTLNLGGFSQSAEHRFPAEQPALWRVLDQTAEPRCGVAIGEMILDCLQPKRRPDRSGARAGF